MKIQYMTIIILNILTMIILSITMLFDYSAITEYLRVMILCIIILLIALIFISLIKSIIELIMYIKSNHKD